MKNASTLFENFTGHNADYIDYVNVPPINVGLTVGTCDGILYTTKRDGKTEQYIHRFRKSSRPLLVVNHDGAQVALIGGNFKFTNRGFVDT